MNSNYTREAKSPLNRTGGGESRYMCRDEKIRALLGVEKFEELLYFISASAEHGDHRGENALKPDAAGECVCYVPVTITADSLLHDLERMLDVFDRAAVTPKDWLELEEGFFDLLFVKFRLYCLQMKQLGRTREVQATRNRLKNALQKRIRVRKAFL